jgi:hypothetical protein
MTFVKNIEVNKVNYSTKVDLENQTFKFTVDNSLKTEKPVSLYKYYPLNNYSIDAVINHYLFSPHPYYLNDKYDCSGELIDYSNLTLEYFINRLVKELGLFSDQRVRELYETAKKWVLERVSVDVNSIILFMKFGIISLTEDSKNILMWSYYNQNNGFTIKLNTSLLPRDFLGPFPINYCEKLEKIDFAKYDSSLCVLYQSNAKKNLWDLENEWRYLTYNKDGKYHPIYSAADIKTRKFFYNSAAIEEIILGYDFFNPKEIKYGLRTPEYDIISLSGKKSKGLKKLKRKLLAFIVTNSIPCKQIIKHRYEFLLDAVEVKIGQLSANKFKIYNSFKQIED